MILWIGGYFWGYCVGVESVPGYWELSGNTIQVNGLSQSKGGGSGRSLRKHGVA